MKASELSDKRNLPPKPPLLPKPTHLANLRSTASHKSKLKTKRPECLGDENNVQNNQSQNSATDIAYAQNKEDKKSNDLDNNQQNFINEPDSISIVKCNSFQYTEDILVKNESLEEVCTEFQPVQSPLNKEKNFNDSENNISPESYMFSKSNESPIEVYENTKTPSDSPCDNVSVNSEIEKYPSVRKRLSCWFNSSFRRGDKGSPESSFYFDCSDSVLNTSPIDAESFTQNTLVVNDNNNGIDCDSLVNLSLDDDSIECDFKQSDPIEAKLRKTYLTAKELVTSEQVYVDVLRLIVEELKEYVQKNSAIPDSVFEKIINPLPQLLRLNEHLLSDLEARIRNWSELPKIADVIVKNGPFLKLYSTYIKNFEEQNNFLDSCCMKYPRFSKILKQFENSERCKKLALKHYMLKPVQRIPQYKLLLREYLDNLSSDSIDYLDTEKALEIIHDVLHHANSSIKHGDYLSKLLQIQSLLGNYEIIKPGREFIREGELYKLSRKERQLRFFILLSDCLLYTTNYGSVTGLKFKSELPLRGMKVYPQVIDPTEFSIITSTRSFSLRARNEEERSEWVNSLLTAINETNLKQLSFVSGNLLMENSLAEPLKMGLQAPVWIQDKKTTMCQICTAEFTVTFRRHHCRCCGKVVCGLCSNNKAPLQYLKFVSARVCEICHDYLFKEYEDNMINILERIKGELNISDEESAATYKNMRHLFKKLDSVKKIKKFIPQRLKEVCGNDSGSSMSGWLLFRKEKRGWKRFWFVLKDQVLYVYKASHDVVAYQSIPVLGYSISRSDSSYEELDSNTVFKLTHAGQTPFEFSAPDKASAEMWVSTLQEASTLKDTNK